MTLDKRFALVCVNDDVLYSHYASDALDALRWHVGGKCRHDQPTARAERVVRVWM
jgi:hypothetical protein